MKAPRLRIKVSNQGCNGYKLYIYEEKDIYIYIKVPDMGRI